MSVVTVRFKSEALGKQTNFNVILPDQGDGPFPVLMQLHGYSDDSFAWLYNSNLVRHVANIPMIVVLPDGGTSRYLNLNFHPRYGLQRYEDLLIRDIRREVTRLFPVQSGKWAIGGLSMGGYGSLRLGMRFPELFASVWAHSAGMVILDGDWVEKLEHPDEANLFVLSERLQQSREAGESTPVISFDCGTEDGLLDSNLKLHQHMETIGLEHHWSTHPGAHTWDYWDLHVQTALKQHCAVFGIEPLVN
jgi:S-formylglutathione hydrolase FrmB